MTSDESRSGRRPGKPQPNRHNGTAFPRALTHDTQWAIAAGPLNADSCRAAEVRAATCLVRQAQADDLWSRYLLGVLRPAEALHVKQVHLTLPPTAPWIDAFRLIRDHGTGAG